MKQGRVKHVWIHPKHSITLYIVRGMEKHRIIDGVHYFHPTSVLLYYQAVAVWAPGG